MYRTHFSLEPVVLMKDPEQLTEAYHDTPGKLITRGEVEKAVHSLPNFQKFNHIDKHQAFVQASFRGELGTIIVDFGWQSDNYSIIVSGEGFVEPQEVYRTINDLAFFLKNPRPTRKRSRDLLD